MYSEFQGSLNYMEGPCPGEGNEEEGQEEDEGGREGGEGGKRGKIGKKC